ncbi:uncharacterized protein LOC102806256 [Saccoglossus kowalevskii]
MAVVLLNQPMVYTDMSTESLVSCQDGWAQRSLNCYQVNENTLSWSDARSACREITGADLVSFDSLEERNIVSELIMPPFPNVYLWIGVTGNYQGDLIYNWVTGHMVPGNIQGWEQGQPDNAAGNEHCVDILAGDAKATGIWRDRSCDTQAGYVCKYRRDHILQSTQRPPTTNIGQTTMAQFTTAVEIATSQPPPTSLTSPSSTATTKTTTTKLTTSESMTTIQYTTQTTIIVESSTKKQTTPVQKTTLLSTLTTPMELMTSPSNTMPQTSTEKVEETTVPRIGSVKMTSSTDAELLFCEDDVYNGVHWPATLSSQSATVSCPSNQSGHVSRYCDSDNGTARWSLPDESDCLHLEGILDEEQLLYQLTLFTIIATSLTSFFAVVIIVAFPILRLLGSASVEVEFSLAVSILLINLTLLIGYQRAQNKLVCTIVAVFLHYLVTTQFHWLTIHAYNTYVMVTTSRPYLRRRIITYRVIGWVCSAVVPIISAGIYYDDYGDALRCFPSGIVTYIMLASFGLLVLVDLFFLGYATKQFSLSNDEPRGPVTKARYAKLRY